MALIAGNDGGNTVNAFETPSRLALDPSVNDIFTGSGIDQITTSARPDGTIFSRGGNDVIIAESTSLTGQVTVFAGAGNDSITLTDGGAGSQLYGGAGNDNFIVNGNAIVFGGTGNNTYTVNSGTGNDFVAGDGLDTFNVLSGSLAPVESRILDFQSGIDVISIDVAGLGAADIIIANDANGNAQISVTPIGVVTTVLGVDATALSLIGATDSFAIV